MKERNEKISRERFIRLGAALGMSIAGASALAACGEESSERSANQPAASNKSAAKAAGGKAAAASQEIAQISKVPAGSAVKFMDSWSPGVLVHLQNGKFVAYSAVCTHEGCAVVYKRGELVCPCHGSVFDPSKGGRVDAVLNGHEHNYERFAEQDPNGKADPQRGIREFVVGTGGESHYPIFEPIANSEVHNDRTYGVLKLTLYPKSYAWRFVPAGGGTFTDSGSSRCHG